MPVYSKSGVMTSKKTNLASSVDLARGIDVYRVDLPGTAWDTSAASVAPSAGSRTAGGSLVGLLSALFVAVLVRRRTASRGAVAVA